MGILDCTISICNVLDRLNLKNYQKEANRVIFKICLIVRSVYSSRVNRNTYVLFRVFSKRVMERERERERERENERERESVCLCERERK